jgi:hypothetical protein
MKVIKEPKMIEVYVNVKYLETESNLVQRFEFSVSNKKYLPYLFDARFLFKNRIETLIKEMLLSGFEKRVDDKDNVEIFYKKQNKPKPCIKNISCYTPPFFGCQYCIKAQNEEKFVYCPEKNKHYVAPGIQRCPVFRCKEEIIT